MSQTVNVAPEQQENKYQQYIRSTALSMIAISICAASVVMNLLHFSSREPDMSDWHDVLFLLAMCALLFGCGVCIGLGAFYCAACRELQEDHKSK